MNRILAASLAAFIFAPLTGCNMAKFGANTTARVIAVAAPASDMESDPVLARDAAPGSLKTIEGFHLASPDNKVFHYVLAKGYCGYAYGFLVDDHEKLSDQAKFDEAAVVAKRATNLFIRCMNYGMRMTGDEKGWQKALWESDLATLEKKLKKAGKGSAGGLYFTALGLANAIGLNRDDIEMVAHLPKVDRILRRVIELDEKYFFGGAHSGMGMLLCSRGKALGGDPENGLEHFNRAIALTEGKYLLPKVLMARHCATIMQDQKLFHDTLVGVLATPPSIFPEQRLSNELAHLRAQRYLAMEKDLF